MIARMVRRLARHARSVAEVSPGTRADDRRVLDDDGSLHHIVMPDIAALTAATNLAAVGFFGQARSDVDHTPIGDLEEQLISTMDGSDGLVAYYNVHWQMKEWGNLVVFVDDGTRSAWGDDDRHRNAVRRAPQHYRSIRLHRAELSGGLTGSIRILRTTYLDFTTSQPWRATRRVG